jgi:hypothetical protein
VVAGSTPGAPAGLPETVQPPGTASEAFANGQTPLQAVEIQSAGSPCRGMSAAVRCATAPPICRGEVGKSYNGPHRLADASGVHKHLGSLLTCDGQSLDASDCACDRAIVQRVTNHLNPCVGGSIEWRGRCFPHCGSGAPSRGWYSQTPSRIRRAWLDGDEVSQRLTDSRDRFGDALGDRRQRYDARASGCEVRDGQA